jgi:hypothetical protein
MASAKRFAYLRETVRNHPAIVASTAATAGVLLGGFVAVQLLGTSQPFANGISKPQAVAEIKAAPVAETTGSAVAGNDGVASAGCEAQTWPYLSQVCTKEYRSRHHAARVVSSDKLDKQMIEAIESKPAEIPSGSPLAAPAPWAPAVASVAPLAPAALAPAASSAAPESPPTAVAATDTEASPALAASQATAKNEAKEKHAANKTKRRPKAERKKPEFDDDDDAVATAYSDERDDGPVADIRHDRTRRIVERGTERDYDVPDEGRGPRRVMVIRRGGGGLFGNLFGGYDD